MTELDFSRLASLLFDLGPGIRRDEREDSYRLSACSSAKARAMAAPAVIRVR